MSHKYVSNKATLQNTNFLSKLSSTLSGKVVSIDDSSDLSGPTTLTWRSTKAISKRIKTATGTIAVYEDMEEEQVEQLQQEAVVAAGGAAPPTAKPVDARAGKAPPPPPPPAPPPPSVGGTTPPGQRYLVTTQYTTEGGAKVVPGLQLVLVTTSSSSKRIRLDDEAEVQILDNAAARHKMAIRPKNRRPDSRALAAASASASNMEVLESSDQKEEELLMQTTDGKQSYWLPKYVVEVDTSAPPPPPPPPITQKRPAEDDDTVPSLTASGDDLRKQMLQEIREFKPKKKRSSSKLGSTPEDEARAKRSATVRELIETEEELVKDLHYAVENYYHHLDLPDTPRLVKDQKDLIFSNFKFFPDFHKNVLIEGIKYHAEVPRMIGKTFLRLERDFDQHAEYCSAEPLAQEFLENNSPIREYFEEHSQKIGDDKRIQEHLQLPIQRLNDYQLLLRELVKYGAILGDDTEELSKALELMQTIPQRATDAKFIASIEGFRGNLYKLGRLIRHDWFTVKEAGHHRAHDRYLFLFKARLLVTKVKRIAGDRSIFLLKNVIRLPETSLGSLDHPKKLEFEHIELESHPNYPIVIEARTPEARDAWLEGVKEHVVETASVDDLLFDDEIRIVSEDGDEVDEGRVVGSPVPEDLEEFPEELDELPEDQTVPQLGGIVVQKPKRKTERIVPIVFEDLEEEQQQEVPQQEPKKARAKGEEDDSPLPARKKARADLQHLEEQLQEQLQQDQRQEQHQFGQSTQESSSFVQATKSRTLVETSSFGGETVVESSTATTTSSSSKTALAAESTISTSVGDHHHHLKEEDNTRQVEIIIADPDGRGSSSTQFVAPSSSVSVSVAEKSSTSGVAESAENLAEVLLKEEEEERLRQQKKEEEEIRKRLEEDKKRKEEERKRKDEERRKEREEEQLKFEEERKKRELKKQEELKRFEEESKRNKEVDMKKKEMNEIERKAIEEERKRLEEERERLEAKRQEDLKRQEEEWNKRDAEMKLNEEQIKKKREEEQLKLEEEKKKKDEERQKKKEDERKKLEEEQKLEEERAKKAEEEKRKIQEEKGRIEHEIRMKEEEAIKWEEENNKRKEEDRLKREMERVEKLRIELEIRKKDDEKRKKEEEQRLKHEEELLIKKEEERKKKEEEMKKNEEELRTKEEEKLGNRRKEEERLKREEEERLLRTREQKIKLDEERKRKEAERLKKEEMRIKREEERLEKLMQEEEERKKQDEVKMLKEKERLIKIEEEKHKRDEVKRKKIEEEERKRKEEEERIRLEEEEMWKIEDEKRKKEIEEWHKLEKVLTEKEKLQQLLKEDEWKKHDAERRRKEEERRAKELESLENLRLKEANRKRDEEEAVRQKEEEKRRKEEDKRRRAREEKARIEREKRQLEEEKRLNEEKKKQEEEERLRKEQEKREEENRKRQEKIREEKRKREEREREEKRLEEERRKQEEIRKQEEEKKKQEEERKEEEEIQIRLEEDKKKKEEERNRREEEKRKQKEEQQLKSEKEKKKRDEERKQEEQKRLAEETKKREEAERKRKEAEVLERNAIEEEKRKFELEKEKLENKRREELKRQEEERNKLEEERKQKEDEIKKKREKEELELEKEKKQKEEEKRKKREEERKKQEEERKLEEDRTIKAEEERRKKEEERKRFEEEIKRKENEEQTRKEEAKKRKQEEKIRKEEERLTQIQHEAEARQKEEEKRKKEEDFRLKQEEEYLIKKEEERKKKEEERKKQEEELRKKDEERIANRLKEEERLRREEEQIRVKAEEQKHKLEDERRRKEAERLRKEAERIKREEERLEKLRTEEEERKKQEEAKRKKEEEKLLRIEQENKKKEEEERARKEEQERKKQKEEDRKRLEDEAKRKKEEEQRKREIKEWNRLEEEQKEKEKLQRLLKEEEQKRKEAERKKKEEERRTKEEGRLDKIKKEEEERKRKEEEAIKLKQEAKQKEIETQKQEREEREKIERKRKLREEKKLKEEEEKKKQLEEERLTKEQKLKEEEEKRKEEKLRKEAKKKEEEQERGQREREEEKRREEENKRREEERKKRKEEEVIALEAAAKAEEEKRQRELEEEEERQRKMAEPTTPGGGPRPVFTKTLVGAVVEPGEQTIFSCNVAHPMPYFVTWLKDNKIMDDKLMDRVQQTDDGCRHELKILNCRSEDTGIYTAKATDTEQAAATCSAQLLVQELTDEEKATRIAEKKPFFIVKLRDTTVIENTNLSYVVHVKGDPMPEVKFIKDGKPLKEDSRVKLHRDVGQGHYELLISHVQKPDAGVYKCQVMNKYGDVDCSATMGVTEEQEAFESLSGKGSLLKAGEKADFKWFRDGQEFDPLERFNVHYKDEEDTLALIFQNVTPEDAGLYTCVASTSCGKISCSAELTVEGAVKRLMKDPVPPEVLEPLSDCAVAAGGSAFLECKIKGYPEPELSWTRNGLDVKVGGRIKQMWEDDDTLSLIIKNIKDSDAGLYRVVAKNELGEAETDCKLAIRAGPKIKSFKKEVACNVGSSLNYSVEVEGEPLPEVRWMKDGKELCDSDRIKLIKESDTTFSFKITSMTISDCGTYTIMASNDIGQRSEQFQVMCDTPPQITRGLDPETEKKLSNDHTFEVRASGSPSPTARWYKDNKEIMGDDKFRMVKDDAFYMLKIRKLDRKDKGVYKIVLSNASGEVESEGALVIRAPPEFLNPLKDACAKEGSKDVKMFVEFQANPKPTIKWTFKDKPIRAETEGFTIKSTDTTSMLVIANATPDFVGNFSITLSNEYGDSVNSAKFRLHEPPAIVEGLKEMVEFLEDNTAKIVVKATGVPVPEIKWTLDGKKYSPDERRIKVKKEGDETYIIWTDEAKTEDSGLYHATVTNCEGTATTEGAVVVNTPPHITKSNFKDGKKVVAMHKFVLEVEASAVPEAVATWSVNNQEIKEAEDVMIKFDGQKYTLERIGCDPEHSGEYTCKLKNKIKEEKETGVVTVYEKESRVRNPLQDLFVIEFNTATIKCQIVGDPVPSVEWLRDGKPIPPSGKFDITEDRSTHWHTLVFKDVAEKDKCVFTVKGKNTHGECQTSCNMGVLVKPQPGDLNSDTVDYGKNVKLNVPIHAYPAPKMVWTQNGKVLEDCQKTRYLRDEENEVYSLQLTSAVLADIGTYAFTASNEAGDATGSCKLHVHSVEPTVGLEIKSRDICLEDEVTFTLKCCGLPLPVPQWTKKGVVQVNNDRTIIRTLEADMHTITFKDVRMEDYGMIEVVATSVVGKTSSSCDLTQLTLPCEVLEGLENLTKGAEGEDVMLSVLIRASPRPAVIWTKDGDQLMDTDKVKITSEKVTYCDLRLSLTLIEATSLESGQYRVKFSNMVNEASSETALVVRPERKAPKIKGKPADAKVTEKGPAMFKCKIAGFPRPDVKWMKDGRQVRPTDVINMGMTADGQFFLEFRHCSPEDAGRYIIVAENEEGRTEAPVTLTVNPPASRPEFLQGLRATKVVRGYPCRMEVKCGGFPKPSIAWLKDGQPLEVDGKHIKQIELEDGTVILQIDDATDADAGRYSCVARNADGDNTSSAPLAVLGNIREDGQPDGPATFTSGLKDTCADEGKTLILPVAVKGGPIPNMKWFKDGKEIKLDDRMFFTYDGDRSFLEIRPCKASDSGVYKCCVEGDDGTKAETECTVTVRKCFEAPSFAQGFNSIQQLPGMDIRLSVRADGVPRPELTWFKDGKPLDFSVERYKLRKDGEATTLLVRECSYSDSAIYKCVATNQEGVADHEAAVEVADEIDPNRRAEAPQFLKVMGDQEVFENDHARFKAVVSGKPIPDFQWLKNGHPIIETNRVVPERDLDGILRLTLRHVTEEDTGLYTLKVWNDFGKASCMGKLACECLSKKIRRPVGDEYQGWDKLKRTGVPVPLPDKPFISALSDRRATVSWNPYVAQGPQPPVTYQVEMCESPEGEWFTARTGIRGTSVDITNLAPKSDYKFRIRNENKYGVSEPSPYVATFRNKLEVPPISYEPKLSVNYESSDDGPYVPQGFTIDRDMAGNYFAAPRFLRLNHLSQYGQRSFNSNIKWFAFGYPTPKIRFTFNGQPLETGVKGGRITHTQEATGEIILFIDKVTEKDVGDYECFAKNEHGESKQKIKFELAEYPRVTQHLEETHIRSHATGRIMCRIAGYPPCDVTWYKDWKPLKSSFRLRAQFIEPDMYILNFNGAIVRDCGLYSLSAVNVAGVATSSCLVQVEDDDDTFVWTGPGKGRHVTINRRRGQLEDHYDVGDELGRGTQGITYHCVEHFTGRNFAAKSMWGRDRFKVWMHLEHEMMNLTNACRYITRLYDCYESAKNMVLVMELCAGGELLNTLTQHQHITEYEVAHYIRQILEGVEYMHDRCIAHLGLNIGDILLTRPNGTDIKLSDLSLSRTIRIAKLQPLDYGMPEFVAPEVASGKGVSYSADMWAVGVITYLLLSGTSPFRGENDRETLTKVQKGELTFDMEAFSNITPEAKDFMAKLLQFKPDNRLEVKAALNHPWLLKSQLCPRDPYKINTDNLRTYAAKFREWYGNASCRRWFRRRPLQSAFTHPSKMVYPPGEVYTPPDSPDRELTTPADIGEYMVPQKDFSYELDPISSDSMYQQGPDTYLLQLRDVDFPVRLRQYMKVAANRSPGYAAQVRENLYDYTSATPQSAEKKSTANAPAPIETVYSLREKYDSSTYDYCCSPGEINLDRYIRIPVVHERRRFTDIMDEEIDDERRKTIVDRYSAGFVRQNATTCSLDLPRRVANEVRSRLQPTPGAAPEGGAAACLPPFLREKPPTCCLGAGRPVTLTVLATGTPAPIIQWFRNDVILSEGGRFLFTSEKTDDKTTRGTLCFSEGRENDVGSYKVVARNIHGQTLHRFRLVQACLPSICDCPEVGGASDTAVLLQWRPPMEDGGAHVQAYHLQIKCQGDIEWGTVEDGVDMERYVVTALQPDSLYQFRIAARNSLGWGDFSIGTPAIRTGPVGCPKLLIPPGLAVEDHKTGAATKQQTDLAIDYSKEDEPVVVKAGDGADLQVRKYKVIDELHRGRFSSVGRCVRADDHRLFAVKVLAKANREEQVRLELDLLRSLRHQRLALLHEAYQASSGDATVLVQELLSGVDVVSYLSQRHEYTEQMIAVLLTQVLDGLSYLQWRGICHLDLQPDNLVVASTRFPSVKLVDFGSARKVTSAGTSVPVNGLTDYIAPEVLFDGKAYPNTDIWSLGVLAYVLLSGVTPFRGDTEEDRKANIQCVRYRFEWLPTTTTQEATRFLMLIFKRDPSKRPTVSECLEHRWLNETEFMVRKRERATIISNRIRDYSKVYHGERSKVVSSNPLLLNFAGLKQ